MAMRETRIKILSYTVCIFLIVLLQSTVLDYIRIYGVKPNLLIIFILCTALLRGWGEGAAVGFFTGMAQDMLFGDFLGFYALLGMYLGLSVGSMNRKLYRDNPLVIIFFSFVSTVIYEAVVILLTMFSSIIGGKADLLYILLNVILPEAVYNSIVSILLFVTVSWLSRKFDEIDRAAHKY